MNFNNTQYIQRFRGQSYGNTPTSGPPYSSTPTYPMSSYLRHRMNSNSSLGEALATLPTPPASNKSKTPDSPASLTTQVLMGKRGGKVTPLSPSGNPTARRRKLSQTTQYFFRSKRFPFNRVQVGNANVGLHFYPMLSG